jgi:hypothetical protein
LDIAFKETQNKVLGLFEEDVFNLEHQYNQDTGFYELELTYTVYYDKVRFLDIWYPAIAYSIPLSEGITERYLNNANELDGNASEYIANSMAFGSSGRTYEISQHLDISESYLRIPEFDIHTDMVRVKQVNVNFNWPSTRASLLPTTGVSSRGTVGAAQLLNLNVNGVSDFNGLGLQTDIPIHNGDILNPIIRNNVRSVSDGKPTVPLIEGKGIRVVPNVSNGVKTADHILPTYTAVNEMERVEEHKNFVTNVDRVGYSYTRVIGDDLRVPIFSVGVSLVPDDLRSLFNMNDLGNIELNEEIKAIIVSGEYEHLTQLFESVLSLEIYQNEKSIPGNPIKVDEDLNVFAVEDLDIRYNYRVLFSVLPNINVLSPRAITRIEENEQLATILHYANGMASATVDVLDTFAVDDNGVRNYVDTESIKVTKMINREVRASMISKIVSIRKGE